MKIRNVLIVGGAGYIGSHMTRLLIDKGFTVSVFNNDYAPAKGRLPLKAAKIKGDLRHYNDILNAMRRGRFDLVMYFAGLINAPESTRIPLRYYEYKEDADTRPINTYGRTKLMFEQVLQDHAAADTEFNFIALRYFNAAGAHESNVLGECHHPETHLIPNILKSIKGEIGAMTLYGDDYPTKDGTCIRDYIHVQDLAEAHYLGIKAMEKGIGNQIVNLGTVKGHSVREIIKQVEAVTGRKVVVRIDKRRPGDPPVLVASSAKARKILGWSAKYDLRGIIRTAWA